VPQAPDDRSTQRLTVLFSHCEELVASLYQQSGAVRWQLSRSQFDSGLSRSAAKRFADSSLSPEPHSHDRFSQDNFVEFLQALYIEDFALACACLEGSDSAWEFFMRDYRGYLRAAAGAITKGSRAGCDAQELADSLFADLFGLADGKRGERSLFRYFHGRSSLKTWLRAILAQRHIDRIRESRRWESIDDPGLGVGLEPDADGPRLDLPEKTPSNPLDPHREEYLSRFAGALQLCLSALSREDHLRLQLYYAQGKKLAEIGRILGEHESSVSRNLERVRKELRASVERHLRSNPTSPMSDAQILLCFQYAAEDVRVDFRQLFPEKNTGKPSAREKESL
jgi:RNA polymerase sigma factor (sigma-70 family)